MTTEPWHSDPLVTKARVLYLRAALLAGVPELSIAQPIAGDSGRDGDVITLKNGPNVIAVWRVRPDGSRLRRLDERRPAPARQPARVEECDFTEEELARSNDHFFAIGRARGLDKPAAAREGDER